MAKDQHPSSSKKPAPDTKEEHLMKDLETKDELKHKLEQLRTKIDQFKDKVLSKFGEYVTGVALLPPVDIDKEKRLIKEMEKREMSKEEEDELRNTLSVLLLVDDSDVKKMTKYELKDKLFKVVDGMAVEVDKNIKPAVKLMSELREDCFDAKYEILQQISLSAIVHDTKDVLKALKVAEIHKTMVLKKFEKYIVSYVAVGSLFRGDARSNDIDVAVVIDDTDVKKMSRAELRDKLMAIIRGMGYDAGSIAGVKKEFHIQVYILTDFWESIKEASPVIFTFLRDGIPLYDRGIYMPWKLLLTMGRIRPSPEAIDMHMDVGDRLVERAKGKMLGIFAEELYYATLNPSQAALMFYGVPPPTPRETIKLMEDIFVKKEKMLEMKYVTTLAKAFQMFKDIEHAKIKEVTGKQIDEMLVQVSEFLKRIKKLFEQIEKKTEKDRITEFCTTAEHMVQDVLGLEAVKATTADRGLKQLVDKGKFTQQHLAMFKEILRLKDNYKKMTKQEIDKVKREGAGFIRLVSDHIQRIRGIELERAKVRVKYGEKFGEILLLNEVAYIVHDLDAKDEEKKFSKAIILPNGGLGQLQDCGFKDVQEAMSHSTLPKKVFIKEKIFEDLRTLFGKDVEILLNY